MRTKTRTVLAAAGAVALLTVPTQAQAADYTMWSKSGKSYIWHDDSANAIKVCDLATGDGIGAHAIVIGNKPQRERIVYNGCETIGNIADGWWQDVTICDWVHEYGQRVNKNCQHTQFRA
ncbi:hypothetical protein JQN72_07980 [Phycicoccus sp. CSK15P-2]|uniref:hypothetical protein n=1 Tax=Phycicoccus sp. CSK15P-2 TaxID=2807627 RepID=UPI00194FCE4C|nr:hypothetical protein [Phycicoccus sp. CSK15P-2]MBM6404181.1 hypothetical protein [Phycicoccus sp. CSK15P-2]